MSWRVAEQDLDTTGVESRHSTPKPTTWLTPDPTEGYKKQKFNNYITRSFLKVKITKTI